jgi:hypothetical protein
LGLGLQVFVSHKQLDEGFAPPHHQRGTVCLASSGRLVSCPIGWAGRRSGVAFKEDIEHFFLISFGHWPVKMYCKQLRKLALIQYLSDLTIA